jgi:CDP-paratose 2-epimerase
MSETIIVTGSSGLIGSEVVAHFAGQGRHVVGIDNNMRADFFGEQGDTRNNQKRLLQQYSSFEHFELDIRDRDKVAAAIKKFQPTAIVHTAAQPSHDLAASRPFDDFDVNANGTLNLLEGLRQFSTDVPFVHLSTNKVYGDAPNNLNLVENESRWDYADDEYFNGIAESFPVDQCTHSLFGASKLAGDVLVQEYGRYFGMPTCCLRGGCLTGPNHSGVELHGFLSYLIKCNVIGRKYTVFGYKGKQVRDNIHSADVAAFIAAFLEKPRVAEVYNIGGGRENSISIHESFKLIEEISGREMQWEYSDQNRVGDHICYISDLSKMRSHYPEWDISRSLPQIFTEIHEAWNGAADP